MPAKFSNLVPVRRVAVGDCSGPQGADGIAELTRTASAALALAGWNVSAESPFFPVHDNGQASNKTIPAGDAWKCSYGYDAAARTERGACGAVCYSFALPDDAVAEGNVANITKVEMSVTGDRYLADGVDVYVARGNNPEPPTLAQFLSSEYNPIGTYCATSSQTAAPNQREGVTASIVYTPTSLAARKYLHVVLVLHDYTSHRGAWIEGGAMLDGGKIAVTFSRVVTGDSEPGPTPSSLFMITGSLENSSGGATDGNTRRVGFMVNATWNYFPNPYSGSYGTRDSIEFDRILPLLKNKRLVDRYCEYGFKNSSDYKIRLFALRYNVSTARSVFIGFSTMGYLAPETSLAGLSFTLPSISVTCESATVVRAGFVQADSIPSENTYSVDDGNYFAIPWNEVVDGDGANLLGLVDVNFSGTQTKDITIPITRAQTKPYIFPVVLFLNTTKQAELSQEANDDSSPPCRLDGTVTVQ